MPTAARPAPGELHAQLTPRADVITVAQRGSDTGPMKASLQPSISAQAQAPADEEHRPTTAAMLLVAVALMTGIALRRGGSDQ